MKVIDSTTGHWLSIRDAAPSARTGRLIVSEACKTSLRIEWSWQTPCTYFKDRHCRAFQSLTLKIFPREKKISTLFASNFCVFLQRLCVRHELHICDCWLSSPFYLAQSAAHMDVHWTVCRCNENAWNIWNIVLFEGLGNFFERGHFEV
jgi:hypothetical protein